MSLELFLDSIKSDETRKCYQRYLKYYGLDNLTIKDSKTIESQLINFIIKLKKEGKSYAAIHNYISALKSYYQINDVILNVRKIGKFMPEHKQVKKDRGYFHQEISKLLEVAELRMRVVILILASSGIRIGALPSIKLGNLQDNKISVYSGDREEYFTFITSECKKAIDAYLDMRSRYGEKLNDDSPLIREEFNIRDLKKPRHVSRNALIFKLDILSKRVGIRTKEVVLAHGFRKFFTTQLINSKINPEIREMLLGHKIGLASAYYRPTEQEMYSEYEKAIDNLTIEESNHLRKKLIQEQINTDGLKAQMESVKKRLERLEST